MAEKHHQNGGIRKICGCPRRTWPKCVHAWHFNFYWKGTTYRLSLDKHAGKHLDSKTAAEGVADSLRTAIRADEFGLPAPREALTLRQLADLYLDRYVAVEHPARDAAFRCAMATICRTVVPCPAGGELALGEWRVADIVTDTIERFREVRRAAGCGGTGVNRNLESWRALFNWAIRVGYVERSPFKRGTEAVVKFSQEVVRSRRLRDKEEALLLAACRPGLRAMVTAALDTGMRAGELRSLQWAQIEGMQIEKQKVTWTKHAEIVLPAAKTKTKRDRRIPIASRLRAILEMRRFDPAGDPLPGDAAVFGNEIGQKSGSFKRAWSRAVLVAHGHKSTYTTTGQLTADVRRLYDAIDLRFHDLRREAGSRWLEGGVPLHTVRDWLGHTNIAQTSTYLAGTMQTQHDAMRRYEQERARLQKLANPSGGGGRKSPPSTGRRAKKTNENGVGRDVGVM